MWWSGERSRAVVSSAVLGVLVVVTPLLVAACTDHPASTGTPPPTGTSEPPAASTAITSTVPASPPTPEVIHVPTPDAEITVGFDEANGIIAIDPATDEIHTVWAGSERMWDIDIYPSLARGGDGIWLSWDDGSHESVRYNLDGVEVAGVPGIFARESPHGTVVAYCVFDGDWGTATLAIRYPDRIVELDEGCTAAVPRDDGRVLFLGPFVDGLQSVRFYDPATDAVVTAIDGVGRPGKDGVIYPTWSPDGRFVTDRSYIEGVPPRHESWLFDTETGQQRSIEPYLTWVADPAGDRLAELTGHGTVRLVDPTETTADVELVLDGRRLIGVEDLGGRVGAMVDDRDGGGHALFDLDGALVRFWEGTGWYATVTTQGLVMHRLNGTIGCTGQEFIDPDGASVLVEFPVICVGGGRLSPDGRFIAVREEGKPGGWIWIMDMETHRLTRFDLGRNDIGMEWSADGSRLVIRVGGGM